ncbi:MAG: glycogen synthase, partial [Clostridiales bacterium]|nr:glycogen synthase [Clostridiales bacterium]
VKVGWRSQYCGVFKLERDGVVYYFLDNEFYFGGDSLYSWNDMEKFIFFQKAALDALYPLGFRPDVIHCHDWQAGLVPVLLDAQYQKGEFYRGIKTVMTIHNLRYQGVFNKNDANEMLEFPRRYYTPDKLEYYGDVNFLKAGIVFADFVTTVSDTYAEEIKQPHFGERLDGLLRAKQGRLGGILNGVDYDVYDPSRDEAIFYRYNARNFVTGKRQNKLALQEELGLEQRAEAPIVGIVSRLVSQKGIDLIAAVMDDFMRMDLQIVVLGTGEPQYEELFRRYARQYGGKVSANITFDNALAHRIYAGSDMFLMPSLFEPCGLSQLIALKYGAIPIVREVGGLKDTVFSYNEYSGEGNGFSFWAYNAHDMLYTVARAANLYRQSKVWNGIVRAAMKCDYSWGASAEHYVNIYQFITRD